MTKKQMEKGDEQKSGRQQPEGERKFSQQQYDLLISCSDKKDMTEWNEWCEKHPKDEIWLQGAKLNNTHLENAYLGFAHLEHAILREAHLENANLVDAHLENANLVGAFLEHAKLQIAHLENAELRGTLLEKAELMEANLRGARFWNAKLQGADFSGTIVDGGTLFDEVCEVDRNTKFEAVALGNLRIYPNIKQLFEYNIRRKNWEVWYPKQKWWLRFITRKFWEMSDYGISTKQVILTFFKWAIVFAIIYYILGAFDYYLVGVKDYPGPIADLFVDEGGPISWCLVPLRSIYFSVVTMTTLGFGDMHANPHNPWWSGFGHILLMLQVLLGYVLLGALITRFAVLFSAGGPAGKFSPIKTKETVNS